VFGEGLWKLWFHAPLLIVGAAPYCVFIGPLKTVRIDDKAFYVSNYRKEIRIPFSDLDRIAENRIISTKPITIHFRRDTEFGRRIVFVPTLVLSSFLGGHPMADKLRELIQRDDKP